MNVTDYIQAYINRNLLWGIERNNSRSFIVDDPFMKVILYSYLSSYDSISEFFPDAKYKIDIWAQLPIVKLYGIQEFPLPHLIHRNYEIPPFNEEPLVVIIGDFNYASKSYARKVILREIENIRDIIRKDLTNLILINTRREDEVEEIIGSILAGSIFRAMGFFVDITGNPVHGIYLEKPFVKGYSVNKYPDIMAWKTDITRILKDEGIITSGVFLPEITVYSLYGAPPPTNINNEIPILDNNILVIGEVEPSYQRTHGGHKQAIEYDELGYADYVFLIAPQVIERNNISTLNLFPIRIKMKKSTKTSLDNKKAQLYILDKITKSALLLNTKPEHIIQSRSIKEWHDIATLPITLELNQIIQLVT